MRTKVDTFILNNYKIFKEIADKYDFDYKMLLAHAALESDWGRKAPGNNYFGIKAGKYWKGKTIDIVTHEYIDGKRIKIIDKFRAYDSIADSIEDYCKLISKSKRYRQAYEARKDPKRYAYLLYISGYSTNPKFPDILYNVYTVVETRIKALKIEEV